MSIIGVTVGTPISPERIENEIKPVKTVNGKAPDENGNVEVEVNGNGNITETDPTVPSWAKEPIKPSYTSSEVGLGNVDNVKQYSASNPPPYPVTSVNGKGGAVTLSASDVGADKSGTASTAISSHNTNTEAHNDLRLLIEGLSTRLNALANSTDNDLDQMAEIVAYIKANKQLIDSVTTSKVSVADIVDNLSTNVTNRPLSAAQGVALKALIDAITVPTKVSELANDAKYLTSFTESDPTVPSWAKQSKKPSYSAEEVGAVSLDALPTAVSAALAQAKESGEFDGEDGRTPYIHDGYWWIGDINTNVKAEGEDGKTAYQYAKDGGYTGTEAEFAKMLAGDVLPDYWESYLPDKIAAIKALQDEGGKDCFSFVVMTDMHYEQNLGKLSPKIAKRIMEECDIKYALILGDMQNRSAQSFTKAQALAEWNAIHDMLSPIIDKALITQGNHDGSYGTSNAFNLTPSEIYNRIYRKVGTNENIHFDESGTGYYIDDNSNKIRFIILNTHCNKYELNADGTAKYGNLDTFRFTQSQYDLVIEALTNIPDDNWNVILGSHIPLDRSGEYVAWGGTVDSNGAQTGNPADCVIMMRLLNAYINKTSYVGSFAGNQGGGAGYVNLADTSSADWATNSRITSSGNIEGGATGRNVTNYIPYTEGDIIKIKGLTLYTSDRFAVYDTNKNRIYLGAGSGLSSCVTTVDGVIHLDTNKIKEISASAAGGVFIRLPVQLVDGEEIIITTGDLNASTEGFDIVSVNADFTNAKGKIISYHSGHAHKDIAWGKDYAWNGAEHSDFYIISTRCDAREENETELINERLVGTTTEQSFDVFTVNKAERKIYATKIGAGSDREISY